MDRVERQTTGSADLSRAGPGNPPQPSWYNDFEPGPIPRCTVFGNGYTGDIEDLPGDGQPKSGVLPEP